MDSVEELRAQIELALAEEAAAKADIDVFANELEQLRAEQRRFQYDRDNHIAELSAIFEKIDQVEAKQRRAVQMEEGGYRKRLDLEQRLRQRLAEVAREKAERVRKEQEQKREREKTPGREYTP